MAGEQFVVVRGWAGKFHGELMQINRETAQCVFVQQPGVSGTRRLYKEKIIARFSEREAAEKLISRLAGIRGELERRVTAARNAADKQFAAALAAATQGN